MREIVSIARYDALNALQNREKKRTVFTLDRICRAQVPVDIREMANQTGEGLRLGSLVSALITKADGLATMATTMSH